MAVEEEMGAAVSTSVSGHCLEREFPTMNTVHSVTSEEPLASPQTLSG
jgi:hypothetical protein